MKGSKYGSTIKKSSNGVPVDINDDPHYEGTVRKVKDGKVCYYPTTQGPIEGDYASGPRSSKNRY